MTNKFLPKIAVEFTAEQLLLAHNILQDKMLELENASEDEFNEAEYQLAASIVFSFKLVAMDVGIMEPEEILGVKPKE